MSTLIDWTSIILAVGSIITAGALTFFIKNIFYKYRRPNGKKGGIISLHTTIAFATVTTIALITKDWFLTGLAVILAYLIGRGRLDEGQHYLYQVVIGAIIGVAIPYGIFYLYNKKMTSSKREYSPEERETYNDKPSHASDDRHEADEVPELRLEDIDGD